MTPEERSLLERTYALSEENNKILRSLRRSGRIATIMRVLYWVVIIGISVGAFYFIQPYIDAITGKAEEVGNNVDKVSSLTSRIQDLLK